ncbi:hypothetical protein [Streptomyces sp. ISL-10]|uniref:hypothetical protein n=1 Tax=Streptomyces sp. ISL-10 TaxID=2819172 RepID=UPI002036112E|nr:hypothetical protein [Streptomyces sp. ISL-10]
MRKGGGVAQFQPRVVDAQRGVSSPFSISLTSSPVAYTLLIDIARSGKAVRIAATRLGRTGVFVAPSRRVRVVPGVRVRRRPRTSARARTSRARLTTSTPHAVSSTPVLPLVNRRRADLAPALLR